MSSTAIPPRPLSGSPAPDFIAIDSSRSGPSSGGHPAAKLHLARAGPPEHLYNRTKRKRESSAHGSPPSHALPEPVSAGPPGPVWNPARRVYSSGVVGLHEEIEDFFQWMTPTPQEHQVRMEVISRIRRVIQTEWREARVDVLGSFKSGLYLPTSDIDLVLFGKWEVIPFRTIEQLLIANNIAEPEMIKILDKAAVPVVKLTDKESKIKVDISFNMACGIRTAELMKFFKRKYPPLAKLAYLLKQFLHQRDLNEVFTGGLSSYALILLIVSFLQMHPRRNAAHASNANLGVLLIEFLELFGKLFNHVNTAIQVTDGGRWIPKSNVNEGGSVICILDPLNPEMDVGRSSYGYVTIVDVSSEDVKFREWLQRKFRNIPDAENADPTLPSRLPVTESHNVEPKQLPDPPKKPLAGQPASLNSTKGQIPAVNHVVSGEELGQRNGRASSRGPSPSSAKSIGTAKVTKTSAIPTRGSHAPKEDSDTASSVSSHGGRSSLMSSVTSPENPCSSDTDSDIMVSHPSGSPNSAMSISPASSEVGSIKSSLSRVSSKSSSKLGSRSSGASSGKKPTFWGQGRGANPKDGPDRADLDLNWRCPNQAVAAVTAVAVAAHAPPAGTTLLSSPLSASVGDCPPLPHPQVPASARGSFHAGKTISGRADQDPNWRNRTPGSNQVVHDGNDRSLLAQNNKKVSNVNRTSSPVKSHGKQWKSRKNQAKKDLTDVTNQLDHNTCHLTNVTNSVPKTATPTTSPPSESVSAKERLTAGLDNSNRTSQDEHNNNNANNNNNTSNNNNSSNIHGALEQVVENTNDNQSGVVIPQKRSKGRRKKVSSLNVRANANNGHKTALREKENHQNPSARFSHGSGLFDGKR
ncbi:hypothetical protein TCAL_12131 [Tigriopus californicus]|uniref:polynucleotide adenylyltransferase n=1 Tax=Tigriopus californicus TaxID=6832 RepID=A0A553N7D2_TIGCA|nr:hypothetical protein TCAL_12131 [Tigriopus californicus]|eukprot:TCALIF_12131-PA protein Name:"Similar to Papd5 Non-canonical poly(A) RNA polymerase PAPD5 (Mus musculus)" AED:0.03 eAED:0.03 QI:381/0.85/0.75/1/1/1/8/565/864